MKFQEIVEAKKKFAEMQTTDYVDTDELAKLITQNGGTDNTLGKLGGIMKLYQQRAKDLFYMIEEEKGGYTVNGKPFPDFVSANEYRKYQGLGDGTVKSVWDWRSDPAAYTRHPLVVKTQNSTKDAIQMVLDQANVHIHIIHFDQDKEMRPQFRLNLNTNEGTRCWKGYKKKGMKTMFGKRVPNCVKEVNTGNPHKGKYVIKTDELGRKDSNIVVMPDEKAAKDMASNLSKKKPDVNYWVELVEDPNYKTKAAMEKFVKSGGKIGDVNDWDDPTSEGKFNQMDAEREFQDMFGKKSDKEAEREFNNTFGGMPHPHAKPYQFVNPYDGKVTGQGPLAGMNIANNNMPSKPEEWRRHGFQKASNGSYFINAQVLKSLVDSNFA